MVWLEVAVDDVGMPAVRHVRGVDVLARQHRQAEQTQHGQTREESTSGRLHRSHYRRRFRAQSNQA
jgi:hypothetical protein